MNEAAWELWTEHGIMRAKVKGKTCERCGGDDFVAEVVAGEKPDQSDMVFSCVKCKWGFRLVNVYPTGVEWGFQESDGVEVKELPMKFEPVGMDPEKVEALRKWREEVVPIPPPKGDLPSFQDFQDRAFAELSGAPRDKLLPGKFTMDKMKLTFTMEKHDGDGDESGREDSEGGPSGVSEDGPGGTGDDPA